MVVFPQIDTDLFLFFNSLHTDWLDGFFWLITQTWTWIPLYLVVLFFIFKRLGRRGFWGLLIVVLIILCTDQTCNLVKKTVQRPRPSHTEQMEGKIHLVKNSAGNAYRGGAYGFPSAHAANTAAFAFFVIIYFRQQRKWVIPTAVVWSLLLSYSRLYLGVHYPLDILCGWCVGLFWSGVWMWFWRWRMRKCGYLRGE